MVPSPSAASPEGIAIIGMHVRVPGATGADRYWELLRDGVESLDRFPPEELVAHGADPQAVRDPRYVGVGRVLDDIDRFDASFFGYSPREAQVLDPQQRLFLEGAWAALEDAGYGARAQRPTTAVFAGEGLGTFMLANLASERDFPSPMDSLVSHLGNDKDFLATRVSYHLDLTGPSATVQTGCSSSLVAVAQAFQALSSFQCDLAVAGGVSIRVPQKRGYLYTEDSILSPDGHCRPFDAKAQGTSFGSGLGIVVLKRIEDALRDGDPIRAVVRGVATNNDGAQKVGYTASNVQRQAEVIAMAQTFAGVDPQSVGLVEAHGTATPLGDPIEAAALIQAFRLGGVRKHYCALGSVKSNVGHLDAASGAAGLIKAVLALEHAAIPPTLFFERPNPAIPLEGSPFYVNQELVDWDTGGKPRRAGVSSFGIGGTNVHVVLEQAPALPPREAEQAPRAMQVLPLSAKTEEALDAQAQQLALHLQQHPDLNLADVAYTLQVGREAMGLRKFVLASSGEDAQACLRQAVDQPALGPTQEGAAPPVIFLLPGQGAQFPQMGRSLYDNEPTFRAKVDRCCELLEPHVGLDLRTLLYPEEGQEEEARARLQETRIAQPALFAVEYASALLWMEWGVYPKAMLGHSLGELVAACLSGVFLIEDAVELVATRGRLMHSLEAGAMLAVPLGRDELEALRPEDIFLAAANTSGLCTVSGTKEAIDAFREDLRAKKVASIPLDVDHAFHSPMVEPILDDFRAAVAKARPRPPGVPFLSNLTGTWVTAAQTTDPDYWAQQLRHPVAFAEGLQTLLEEPARAFLEVGPGNTLATFAEEESSPGRVILSSMAGALDARPDLEILLPSLGRLWQAGAEIDWACVHAPFEPRRLPLPTYPFAKESHWPSLAKRADPPRGIDSWFHLPSWRRGPRPLRRPEASAERPSTPAADPILAFLPEGGSWDPLLQRLEAQHARVVVVRPGDAFAQLDADRFTLDPTCSEDFTRLVDAQGEAGLPRRILHLWLATAEPPLPCHAVERGLACLQRLVAAVDERDPGGALDLTVGSIGGQEVADDALVPQVATLLGAVRVLPQEYPETRVSWVDLEGGSSAADQEARDVAVWAQLTEPPEAPITAVRKGYRWFPSLEEVPMPSPAAGAGLRERGVYLITGGLGGIGLVLAHYLASAVQARLILCSRGGSLAQEEREAIEAQGAEVQVIHADVSDREGMAKAVGEACATFGDLNGILHAAGIPGKGLGSPATTDREASEDALRAKMYGTLVMEQHAGPDLDFVVYCSALATQLGGLGQADYVAGNAFLDAMALSKQGQAGPRVLSLAYDTWAETGMAVEAEVPESLKARQQAILRAGLLNAEGVEVFRRALASGAPHVVVSKSPLEARMAGEDPAEDAPDLDQEAAPQAQAWDEVPVAFPSSTSLPAAVGTAPQGVAETVSSIWNQLLGVSSTRHDQNFFEQGGNSLLATQMLARLRGHYPWSEFSLRGFFDDPTLQGLIGTITEGPDAPGETADPRPGVGTTNQDPRPEADNLAGIQALLEREVAMAIDARPESIDGRTRFADHDEVLLAAHLTDALQKTFELPFYPHEVRNVETVADLATHIQTELERREAPTADATLPTESAEAEALEPSQVRTPEPKRPASAPPIAFLLSAPRSGSTLLRLMLSAHPGLLCPPELFLLDHATMGGWNSDPFAEFYRDGIVRGLMEQRGLDFQDAQTLVEVLVDRDAPVEEAYALLQATEGRMLVDKTPTYGADPESLARAEALFRDPRYLILVRHPYAVIDSVVHNRLDRVRQAEGDSHAVAEEQWVKTYRHSGDLAAGPAKDRCHVVRYEDLMADPRTVLTAACGFLGIDFLEEMLDPYGHGRMLGGPGDPHLFARGAVDPTLAEAWKKVRLPQPVGPECVRLAESFGYPCPS